MSVWFYIKLHYNKCMEFLVVQGVAKKVNPQSFFAVFWQLFQILI